MTIIRDLPSAQPERCSDCIAHGGDWECDHMHCRKGRLPSAQSERTETHACDLISRLSEIRSEYNCFDEDEEPQYRALSEAIKILSQRADGDVISRQAAIDAVIKRDANCGIDSAEVLKWLPPAQPEIIMCKDCKHNPKDTWFECPMAYCSETQRPETAWCWKGERREE